MNKQQGRFTCDETPFPVYIPVKCSYFGMSGLAFSSWWNVSSAPFATTAGEYMFSMFRHFLGHVSTQALQAMQRRRLICQSLDAFVTMIAAVGHFFWQMPQKMHLSISIEMLPRVILYGARFSKGYNRVAGRERRLRAITFPKDICAIVNAPYS
jgi:hypothetical protein